MTAAPPTSELAAFLTRMLDADEAAARACAEAFPSPWEVSDRGWRVRIYASDVPDTGDHADPGDMRAACVIEVEPQLHHNELNEGGWLSDRVDHIARHDPARVLAQVAALRAVVAEHEPYPTGHCITCTPPDHSWADYEPDFAKWPCPTLRRLAAIWADNEAFDPAWSA